MNAKQLKKRTEAVEVLRVLQQEHRAAYDYFDQQYKRFRMTPGAPIQRAIAKRDREYHKKAYEALETVLST